MNEELLQTKAELEAMKGSVKETAAALTNYAETGVWDKSLVLTLSIAILVFGILIIGIMALLIMKNCDARLVLRAFCVPLIVVAAIFLVVTGYSQDQIAPVIGLLGTIAGYLLGTNERIHSRQQTVEDPG